MALAGYIIFPAASLGFPYEYCSRTTKKKHINIAMDKNNQERISNSDILFKHIRKFVPTDKHLRQFDLCTNLQYLLLTCVALSRNFYQGVVNASKDGLRLISSNLEASTQF
jgi:hypothetical protein